MQCGCGWAAYEIHLSGRDDAHGGRRLIWVDDEVDIGAEEVLGEEATLRMPPKKPEPPVMSTFFIASFILCIPNV
jgi:hypothetical protein